MIRVKLTVPEALYVGTIASLPLFAVRGLPGGVSIPLGCMLLMLIWMGVRAILTGRLVDEAGVAQAHATALARVFFPDNFLAFAGYKGGRKDVTFTTDADENEAALVQAEVAHKAGWLEPKPGFGTEHSIRQQQKYIPGLTTRPKVYVFNDRVLSGAAAVSDEKNDGGGDGNDETTS